MRVPLRDLDLVRWSLTLPDNALIRRGQGKWLAKQMALRHLPRGTFLHPRRGFGAPGGELADGRAPRRSRELHRASYFNWATRLLDTFVSGST